MIVGRSLEVHACFKDNTEAFKIIMLKRGVKQLGRAEAHAKVASFFKKAYTQKK
jgi:hypothetical protein